MSSLFLSKPPRDQLDLHRVKAVFFDLDGTLIDVDMHRFVPSYLHLLTWQMRDHASPAHAVQVLHHAVAAMFANQDAARTLESILLETLEIELSISAEDYADCLERLCCDDLESMRPLVAGHPLSSQLINTCLSRGWQVILATNPIFPRAVVDARLAWGGLDGTSFHHVTAYETEHFCKPNPNFFNELLGRLQLPAEACLMVGNDTLHDLAASRVGMPTCLLTPWCIERPGGDFPADWHGDHEQLLQLINRGFPSPGGKARPD